jgi:hypothetical protein
MNGFFKVGGAAFLDVPGCASLECFFEVSVIRVVGHNNDSHGRAALGDALGCLKTVHDRHRNV